MTTGITVRDAAELTPLAFHTDAREVAQGAHDNLLDLLDRLEPGDWARPTECPEWTVADMVGHLIGHAQMGASLREMMRKQRWANRHRAEFGGSDLDALTTLEVREHAHLSPAERVAALRELAPRSVAGRMGWRRRMLRWVRVPARPAGSMPAGSPDSLTFGQLSTTIGTRDTWMHTIDIARATDRSWQPTTTADRRIVEDVVAEWAGRHGQPFRMNLSGPAGGAYQQGRGGQRIELDAVEFCRILSGRGDGDGLLTTRVIF